MHTIGMLTPGITGVMPAETKMLSSRKYDKILKNVHLTFLQIYFLSVRSYHSSSSELSRTEITKSHAEISEQRNSSDRTLTQSLRTTDLSSVLLWSFKKLTLNVFLQRNVKQRTAVRLIQTGERCLEVLLIGIGIHHTVWRRNDCGRSENWTQPAPG